MGNVTPMAFAKFIWIHLLSTDEPNKQCIRMQCKPEEVINDNDIETVLNFIKSKFDSKVEISHHTFKKKPTLVIMIDNLDEDDQEKLHQLMVEIKKK